MHPLSPEEHLSKDKSITILPGSIRSTKTWTLSAKQLFIRGCADIRHHEPRHAAAIAP